MEIWRVPEVSKLLFASVHSSKGFGNSKYVKT
jgi:hypothetical protein